MNYSGRISKIISLLNSKKQEVNTSSVPSVDDQDQEGSLPREMDFETIPNSDEQLLEMADRTLLEVQKNLEKVDPFEDPLPSCSKGVPNKTRDVSEDVSFCLTESNFSTTELHFQNDYEKSGSEEEEDNSKDQTYIQDENETDSSSDDAIENVLPQEAPLQNPNLGENEIPELVSRSRKKRRHMNQSEWIKNSEKLKRQSGQQYFGKRKLEGEWNYHIIKKPKTMKASCKCNNKKTGPKCEDVLEEERTKLFEKFWKLSWTEKQLYVRTLVEKNPVKRIRNRKVEN